MMGKTSALREALEMLQDMDMGSIGTTPVRALWKITPNGKYV
jgi:hypothetical protein